MSTPAEIENAAEKLSVVEKEELSFSAALHETPYESRGLSRSGTLA